MVEPQKGYTALPEEQKKLQAMEVLSGFSNNHTQQGVQDFSDIATTVPDVAHALQTAFRIGRNISQTTFVVPVFDGTYDIGEIFEAEIPVEFIVVEDMGNYLDLASVTQDGENISNNYFVTIPFGQDGVLDPSTLPDHVMKAESVKGADVESFTPHTNSDVSNLEGYLAFLREGVKSIMTATAHYELIKMFEQAVNYHPHVNVETKYTYSDMWAKLLQFAHTDLVVTDPTELPNLTQSVARYMIKVISEANGDISTNPDAPTVIQCSKDRSKFDSPGYLDRSINSVMVCRSDEKLNLVGMLLKADSSCSTKYILTLQLNETTSGMHAQDTAAGKEFDPPANPESLEVMQGYLNVAQMAAKDILSIVHLPYKVTSV